MREEYVHGKTEENAPDSLSHSHRQIVTAHHKHARGATCSITESSSSSENWSSEFSRISANRKSFSSSLLM